MNSSRKVIRSSILGLVVNIVLAAFKAVVGTTAGFVAVLMDAVNNFGDALSSVITAAGTKLAGKVPHKASLRLR